MLPLGIKIGSIHRCAARACWTSYGSNLGGARDQELVEGGRIYTSSVDPRVGPIHFVQMPLFPARTRKRRTTNVDVAPWDPNIRSQAATVHLQYYVISPRPRRVLFRVHFQPEINITSTRKSTSWRPRNFQVDCADLGLKFLVERLSIDAIIFGVEN